MPHCKLCLQHRVLILFDRFAKSSMSVSRNIVHISSAGEDFETAIRCTFQAAMANDPIARYLFRPASYEEFWNSMIDKHINSKPSNLNIALEGAETGVLACMYPSEAQASYWANMLFTLRMILLGYLSRALAGARLGDEMDAGQKAYAKEHGEFLYVFLAGTRPEHQGQGLGSVLLRHISEHADARGLHCYLEASSEGSRRLYERHGYEVIGVCKVAKDAPPLYRMGRPPKPRPAADQAATAIQ